MTQAQPQTQQQPQQQQPNPQQMQQMAQMVAMAQMAQMAQMAHMAHMAQGMQGAQSTDPNSPTAPRMLPGKQPAPMSHIMKGIWIGGYTGLDGAVLQQYNIRTVVQTAIEFHKEHPQFVNWDEIQKRGITVIHLDWDDTLDEKIYPSPGMQIGVQAIADAVNKGDGVLINCAMGRSRSASCTMGYLMGQGMSFEEALKVIQQSRPQCKPNNNFERQLRHMERDLRQKQSSSGFGVISTTQPTAAGNPFATTSLGCRPTAPQSTATPPAQAPPPLPSALLTTLNTNNVVAASTAQLGRANTFAGPNPPTTTNLGNNVLVGNRPQRPTPLVAGAGGGTPATGRFGSPATPTTPASGGSTGSSRFPQPPNIQGPGAPNYSAAVAAGLTNLGSNNGSAPSTPVTPTSPRFNYQNHNHTAGAQQQTPYQSLYSQFLGLGGGQGQNNDNNLFAQLNFNRNNVDTGTSQNPYLNSFLGNTNQVDQHGGTPGMGAYGAYGAAAGFNKGGPQQGAALGGYGAQQHNNNFMNNMNVNSAPVNNMGTMNGFRAGGQNAGVGGIGIANNQTSSNLANMLSGAAAQHGGGIGGFGQGGIGSGRGGLGGAGLGNNLGGAGGLGNNVGGLGGALGGMKGLGGGYGNLGGNVQNMQNNNMQNMGNIGNMGALGNMGNNYGMNSMNNGNYGGGLGGLLGMDSMRRRSF